MEIVELFLSPEKMELYLRLMAKNPNNILIKDFLSLITNIYL
jgi:hypothetical protein